ncbi:MAG: hypothetical protein KJ646_02885 [Nanoarchaeota archaeon]|nr:hypothetical protein [Nanoarchaeota archaeon]
MECFKCNAFGVKLIEVISGEGIIMVCEKCASEYDMPAINKIFPSSFSPEFPEKKQTVYDRLALISGVSLKDGPRENPSKEQEFELKKIVDKNYAKIISAKPAKRDDLIDNFHWVIMRARRAKHITHAQMAKAISEPEPAIKMAEKGILPQKACDRFIDKIENYLGIQILKRQNNSDFSSKFDLKQEFVENPSFDPIITKNLTINDLRELKIKKEQAILGKKEAPLGVYPKGTRPQSTELRGKEQADSKKEIKEKRDYSDDKGDISQEEIDRIIFGK